MGLYFVLILSVFTLCNVYAENYLGPTDESIKNKIRRGDLEEGFLGKFSFTNSNFCKRRISHLVIISRYLILFINTAADFVL